MISLVIEIALKASVVASVALLLVTQLNHLPAAQRALIAHLGLALALLMPALVLFGPEIGIVGPWSPALSAAIAADAASSAGTIAPASTAVISPAPQAIDALGAFALCYGIVATVLLLRLAAGLVQLGRLRRDAHIIADGDWLTALARVQRRLGVRQSVTLILSDRLASPVSWGLLRPTIMLNPAALNASDRADAILSHELAHVARMDWVNLLLSRIAVAVLWITPLVWLLARRAHDLREQAADDIVLDSQVQNTDYATLLVDFARPSGQGALAANAMAQGKESLKRRLKHILDETVRRDRARPIWTTGCIVTALALAAPLGALTPILQIRPALAADVAKPAPSTETHPRMAAEHRHLARAEEKPVRADVLPPRVTPLLPPAATRADLEQAARQAARVMIDRMRNDDTLRLQALATPGEAFPPLTDLRRFAEAQSHLNLEKVRTEAEQSPLDAIPNSAVLPPPAQLHLPPISVAELNRDLAEAKSREALEKARLNAQARIDMARDLTLLRRYNERLQSDTLAAAREHEQAAAEVARAQERAQAAPTPAQ